MVSRMTEARRRDAREHGARSDPEYAPWPAGAQSRPSRVRSGIRRVRIARDEAERARGGACPSQKHVRKAHQGRAATLPCISIQYHNMWLLRHVARRTSEAILAALVGGLC